MVPDTADVPARYALAFELAPVPLLLVDPDGVIRLTNTASEELFEYPAGALRGRAVEVLLPATTRDLHQRLRDEYREAPVDRQMGRGRDLAGVSSTGRTLPLELGLKPVRDADGVWVVVTCVDISARRAADLLQRTVLDASASAMIVVGQDGNIVLANRTGLDLFGYGEAELIGAPIERLVPDAIGDAHRVFRNSFFAATTPRPMGDGKTLHGRRRDGTTFRIEVALTPIDMDGSRAVLATIVDLADRIAAERALAAKETAEAQASHLTQLNSELTQFTYSVSHDLRAPFARIRGIADLCLSEPDGQLDTALHKDLQRIRDAGERGMATVDALLRLARIGVDELEPAAIDIESEVDTTWKSLFIRAPATLRLRTNFGHHAPLTCDQAAIRLILTNLLSNAIKFCNPADGAAEVAVSTHNDASQFVIVVADNGDGVPPEHRESIFGAFERLTNKPGDGLGLAIVRRLARRLQGDVTCDPVEKGAAFTVRLPLAS